MIQEKSLMHVSMKYDSKKKNLTIYYNGKLYAGMIGKIAELRFKAIKAEMERLNKLNQVRNYDDGHKKETTKV